MPWEIDYVLLTFSQLKKSKYYLTEDVNITIDSVLNLSSYLINWEESKLPKEYFIDKYNQLSILLSDYNHNKKIYEGDKIYGHLDLQRECIRKETDYYISICPDMYFSEYLLAYLIESTKQIKNKYFVVTPQISKVGDTNWDEITDPKYINIPYDEYLNVDIFDIIYNNVNSDQEKSLYPTQKSKWAGWFDLYSKEFYEELCPVQDDWKGYGPWDWYSIIITNHVKQHGVDFQQYLLKGETIWMYPTGPLIKDGMNGFAKYYKDFISLNNIPNQRQNFENKMNDYVNQTLTNLKNKNII
jgi:hypothetical protein